jgi:hypothetical protein
MQVGSLLFGAPFSQKGGFTFAILFFRFPKCLQNQICRHFPFLDFLCLQNVSCFHFQYSHGVLLSLYTNPWVNGLHFKNGSIAMGVP